MLCDIKGIAETEKEIELIATIQENINKLNNQGGTDKEALDMAEDLKKKFFDSKECTSIFLYLLYKYLTPKDSNAEIINLLGHEAKVYIQSITGILYEDYKYKLSRGATYVSRAIF
jgi:hypothetical protein